MPTDSSRLSPALRRLVAERAKGMCEYCRTPEQFATQNFSLDHILPRAAGGATILENLAWACMGCNANKHTRTHADDPETRARIALFNPRLQNWQDHFAWSDDASLVFGRTACGRVTVQALQLNRVGLVNLRRVLIAAKLFPSGENQ